MEQAAVRLRIKTFLAKCSPHSVPQCCCAKGTCTCHTGPVAATTLMLHNAFIGLWWRQTGLVSPLDLKVRTTSLQAHHTPTYSAYIDVAHSVNTCCVLLLLLLYSVFVGFLLFDFLIYFLLVCILFCCNFPIKRPIALVCVCVYFPLARYVLTLTSHNSMTVDHMCCLFKCKTYGNCLQSLLLLSLWQAACCCGLCVRSIVWAASSFVVIYYGIEMVFYLDT